MADDLAGSSVEVLLSSGNPRDSLRSSASSTAVPSSPESSGGGGRHGRSDPGNYAKSCSDSQAAARAAVAAMCQATDNLKIRAKSASGRNCLRGVSRGSPTSCARADDTVSPKASQGFPSSAHARYRQEVVYTDEGTCAESVGPPSSRSTLPSSKSNAGTFVAWSPSGRRNTPRRRTSSSPCRSKSQSSPRKGPSSPQGCVKASQYGALASFHDAKEAAEAAGISLSTYSECRRASDNRRIEALRQLQASHQERASELAEMAVRTASRIDACLSLDMEEARAQLLQDRQARRSNGIQRLQCENQEMEAHLDRVQPRVDNLLPSAYSRGMSPVGDRSISSSISNEALAAHRRHLRELTSCAEARIDGCLSPKTQELRNRAAEQRVVIQASEDAAMRERQQQVRELVDSAKPRVDRELSPESNARRREFDNARQHARSHDELSFSTKSQELRDISENTPRRVETSLSARTLDDRCVAESARQQRLEMRHRDIQEHSKYVRELVAMRSSVVDAYIDAEVRAKIRKEVPQALKDATPTIIVPPMTSIDASSRAPMHHQQLWQAVQSSAVCSMTSREQEQSFSKSEADDLERTMTPVNQELQETTTTQRPSPCRSLRDDESSCQRVEMDLAALQDQLRADHQARAWQSIQMVDGSARAAPLAFSPLPVFNPTSAGENTGHSTILTTTSWGERPADSASIGSAHSSPSHGKSPMKDAKDYTMHTPNVSGSYLEFTSFMEDQRHQDVGSFVAT